MLKEVILASYPSLGLLLLRSSKGTNFEKLIVLEGDILRNDA